MPNYTFQKKTQEELNQDNRSEYQKKRKVANIRQAILRSDPTAYDLVDKKMTAEQEADRQTVVHGGTGRRKEQTGSVFELNIAGSGFTEFRAMHKHLPGKHAIQTDLADKKARISFQKPIKVKLHNILFGWLPFVRSPAEIKKMNEMAPAAGKQLDDYYGKRWVDPRTGKQDKYIRAKQVSEKKFRVTMPGPEGNLDRGDYSTNNLRKKMLDITKDYLQQKFESFKNGTTQPEPISINLRGHSRGGVAVGEGMQMVMSWVKDTYPQYENLVKYSMIQYDPVPGHFSFDEHPSVDYDSKTVADAQGMEKRGNAPKENTNNTVIYALSVGEDFAHKKFFEPQPVDGANRIILMPKRHGVGVGDVDASQPGELHREGYTFAENGHVYRGTGLEDLPKGIFIMDENNTLIQLKTPQQAKQVLNEVMKDSPGEIDRKNTISHCLGTWFDRNLPEKVKERKEAVEQIKEYQKSKLPEQLKERDAIPIRNTPEGRSYVANRLYLQLCIRNADTLPVNQLKNALTEKTRAANSISLMNNPKFDELMKKADGKVVKLDSLAEKFADMHVRYPKKVDKPLQVIGTLAPQNRKKGPERNNNAPQMQGP